MDAGLTAIRVSNLTREMSGVLAVNSVSFEARFGKILGVLGPNGAGKTTLLRMLAGLLIPSAGRLEVCGRSSPEELFAIKREVGFLTGTMRLYAALTPLESLEFLGRMRRMPESQIRSRCDELISELGMSSFCRRRFAKLSSGERQRAQVAGALLHDPRVLILDEITVSMDIMSSQAVLSFIRREKERGKCVLFSTHVMSEAEYLCDEILMIHRGKVLDRGASRELIERHDSTNLTEAFLAAVRDSDFVSREGVRRMKGPIATVFLKEMKETLRDWKALIVTYGMPLIFYPILFVWMAEAVAVRTEKERGEHYAYARLGPPSLEIDDALKGLDRFEELKPASPESVARVADEWLKGRSREGEIALRSALATAKVQALIFDTQAQEKRIRVLYDPTDGRSTRASQIIVERFREQGTKLLHTRLEELKLTSGQLFPLSAELEMLSGPIRAAVPVYGPILLSLIVIVLCLSAYYPALGATVAERENGTLQTLLSTAARPRDLVIGKFVAVWLSSLLGLTSYSIPALILLKLTLGKARPEALPLGDLPWLAVSMIALSFLLSAVSLALGFLARKQSVAQAMLSVLLLSSTLPGVLVTTGDIDPSALAAAVPFVNLAVLAKTLFAHSISVIDWILSIASNGIAGLFMVAFSCHLLENETRGESALCVMRKSEENWVKEPTADLSFLYYALALGLSFYSSLVLSSANILWSLFLPQLVLLLAAPALMVRALRLSARETFLLRLPHWASVPISALLGFALAVAMAGVLSHVKIPEAMGEEIERRLGFGSGTTPFTLIVSLALLPALCEEFAFRGLILSGLLRRFSPLIAIIASAAMFAFMHVSLVRFAPTFIVGLALGFLAYRTRSLLPGMLAHASYNLSLIVLSHAESGNTVLPASPSGLASAWIAVGVCAALVARVTRTPRGASAKQQSPPERLAS